METLLRICKDMILVKRMDLKPTCPDVLILRHFLQSSIKNFTALRRGSESRSLARIGKKRKKFAPTVRNWNYAQRSSVLRAITEPPWVVSQLSIYAHLSCCAGDAVGVSKSHGPFIENGTKLILSFLNTYKMYI